MNKVVVVIPYFGHWPEWIELYFYSCGRNPMIDFVFYTDCPPPKHQYENTKFVYVSIADYCKFVSARLGIDYKITNLYKLTDLKPFIGVIHEFELCKYEFWGFGDLDLVYGDLSKIVNENNLRQYDVITTHNYHIAGHFTLCRNNQYYRTLCFRICDWKQRLVADEHFGFDESEWSRLVYPGMKWVRRIYDYICKPLGVKFYSYMERANHIAAPRLLFSEFQTTPIPKLGQIYRYDIQSGNIFNPVNVCLPYLHFLFFKKTPWRNTEIYWKNGYYKLDVDFEKYHTITFDADSVMGYL